MQMQIYDILRKPITCGICFTFLMAFVFSILFDFRMPSLQLKFNFNDFDWLVSFFSTWMVLGVGSAFLVYVFDTFFQISHYYKHKAHKD